MHFELLVEDKSGCIAVDAVLENLLGTNGSPHSWKTHSYKGLGRIPRNLRGQTNPTKRLLLDRLPRVLQGYGKSLGNWAAVVVVVDLDDRDCIAFKHELLDVLNSCDPRPATLFRIAIEEIEAWLLGDREAVKAAYPRAKDSILDAYSQDGICGTWEVLADAVHVGGSAALAKSGWPTPGVAKCQWAGKIAPHIDPDRNRSPSFQAFRDGVLRLAAGG